MGLFSSSKSRSTVNNVSTITNIDNSFTKHEVNNIDARQDKRQFFDNRVTTTNIVDARQDNRQFIDGRQYTSIDSRQTHNVDHSITVGEGGINATGDVTITEIDNGAIDRAFDFADSALSQSVAAVSAVSDEVLKNTEASFARFSSRNTMIMAGIAAVAVAASAGIAIYNQRAAA